MTWCNLQAEIADLFEGQSRRDRWDSSNGAPASSARATPLGMALGLYLARSQNAKLTRAGVKHLAAHRARLVEKFALESACSVLAERCGEMRKWVAQQKGRSRG